MDVLSALQKYVDFLSIDFVLGCYVLELFALHLREAYPVNIHKTIYILLECELSSLSCWKTWE